MENIEKVYVIQPRLNDNCKVLHDEAVALIESAGAQYCGTAYQTIKTINPATYIVRASSNTYARCLPGSTT